jgi:hypothetical protein
MARPNLLDNIDELLDIASQPKKRKNKEIKQNPEIDSFISEQDITSGKKRIPTSVIYYRYYLWKQIRLISRQKFFSYFKTKFEKTRTDHGIGYLLNPKGFDLSPVGFFRARAFLRKERDEKGKK